MKNPTVGEMKSQFLEIKSQYKSDVKKTKLCLGLAITVLVIGLLAVAGVGAGTYLAFTGPTMAARLVYAGLAYAGVIAFLGLVILGALPSE